MYSIFKKKPKLQDLIPQGYIDIHSHILPGIDDGAKTLEQTTEMMESLKSKGFSKCIATPHINPGVWNNNPEIIKDTYQHTKQSLQNEQQQMLFHCASEYMINDTFIPRLTSEPLMPLKENYVLVELSYVNPPLGLSEIMFEIRQKGYQPILAHPERYFYYHQDSTMYENLKNMGVMFQLNLLSSVGYYGPAVAKIADLLLKENSIDFVGSDIHHMRHAEAFDHKMILKSESQLQSAMAKNAFFAT
jgi:protein-tyrosine phosphatase